MCYNGIQNLIEIWAIAIIKTLCFLSWNEPLHHQNTPHLLPTRHIVIQESSLYVCKQEYAKNGKLVFTDISYQPLLQALLHLSVLSLGQTGILWFYTIPVGEFPTLYLIHKLYHKHTTSTHMLQKRKLQTQTVKLPRATGDRLSQHTVRRCRLYVNWSSVAYWKMNHNLLKKCPIQHTCSITKIWR